MLGGLPGEDGVHMNGWLLLAVVLALLAAGVAAWLTRRESANEARGRSPFMGLFMPLLFLALFTPQLLELIPGLTLVDIGALFVMGGVSGYFLHAIVSRRDMRH